jgi:6-pyruvoyltetrahydropterin/6-carboxytetrahydropterin synthase
MAERFALVVCDFWFEASHVLARAEWTAEENRRVFGPCVQLHGHSYHLKVTLRGPIDPATGMVVNFNDVKAAVGERVLGRLDHQHLNDIVAEIPTAENLLYWIAAALLPAFGPTLHRLALWETRTAGAMLTERELQALLADRPGGAG